MLSANSFVSNNSSTVAKSAQKSKQLNNTTVIRPVLTVQEKLAQDSPSLPPQVSLYFLIHFLDYQLVHLKK